MRKRPKKSKSTNRTPKKRSGKKLQPLTATSAADEPAPTTALVALNPKKQKALDKFKIAGTVLHACLAAGIHRRTWYDWIENDPVFAAAAVEATEGVTDELEDEAMKRAKEGDTTLIIFLLKSRRPDTYRETHKIELVSPAVRESLRKTIEIINEELEPDDARRLLDRLDVVWSAAA